MLPVATKPNKQRQGLNLYGRFIQIHILTDHLPFSSQAKVFIAGNKQGGVRDFETQGKVNWIRKNNFSILVLGSGL